MSHHPRDDRDDAVASRLGRLLQAASAEREAARRDTPELRRRDGAMRQRLVEAISEEPRGIGGWIARLSTAQWAWFRGAFGTAMFAAAALAVFVLTRAHALDYGVTGATAVAGYVRAERGAATVVFEDGTAFELAPGGSGRVGDVRANGARFILEDGAVDARVEKLPGAAWSIHAGPWEIRVTGTAFSTSWDARERQLRVGMREGSVIVVGPGAESGIGLRAGQSLVASSEGAIEVASARDAAPDALEKGALQDGAADPHGRGASAGEDGAAASLPAPALPGTGLPTSWSAAPGSAATGSSATGSSATGSSTSPELPGDPTRSWTARVAAGDYDGVLADAEARGVDTVLGTASSADISAVADAARYRGRSGIATRALQALRGRFASTPAAANGAFLLGRMADDAGSPSSAIRWYDVHIAEGGAFAAEALGRKMLAVRRSSGEASAAVVARSYLERFPGGAHAALARALMGPAPEPGVMPLTP